MASLTEAQKIHSVVKMEGLSLYSRELLVIKSSEAVIIGDVLGSNGTDYEPLNVDASSAPFDDDAEAICIEKMTGDGTKKALCIVRHAIVAKDELDYDAASSAAVADTALKVLGIVVRQQAPKAAQA